MRTMIRLVLGGAFDRFPKLQVIVGHMGEGLAFMMISADHPYASMTEARAFLDRLPVARPIARESRIRTPNAC